MVDAIDSKSVAFAGVLVRVQLEVPVVVWRVFGPCVDCVSGN